MTTVPDEKEYASLNFFVQEHFTLLNCNANIPKIQ